MKSLLFIRRLSLPLVILLALSACATSPATPTVIPSPVTATPALTPTIASTATTAAAATPLPTQVPSQVSQILDLAYAGRIWVLAATQEANGNGLILLDSSNGGSTWESHSIPGALPAWVGAAPAPNTARNVVFLNQDDGWVYGPGLYATQDGGATWQQTNMPEEITALAPMAGPGAQTWALAGNCPTTGGNCTYHLLGLNTQTGAWQPLSNFPPLSAGPDASLFRPDAHSALVFAAELSGQAGQPSNFFLWSSAGSGPWKKIDTPCQKAAQERLSISPEGQYWLLCGGDPSAGAEGKTVYVSTDQGQTWELRSTTDFGQLTGTPTLSPGSQPLPIYGYTDDLLALSKNEALMGLGRSIVYLITDGGQKWEAVMPIDEANPGGNSGWSIVRNPGSNEVWASVGTALLRTTDLGLTWNRVKY
ncbi:MAG: hypothetical protein M1281_03325 [Chloroflexi bacterium]|nr:hypothetical protein [Chloroflexota bacterium]